MKKNLFALFIVSIVLNSCDTHQKEKEQNATGDSLGSLVSVVHNSLEKQINSESDGGIKLVQFAKTDGQEQLVDGVKLYIMDFKTTIEYNISCYKSIFHNQVSYNDFSVMATKPKPDGYSYDNGAVMHYDKGMKVLLTGKAQFEMKESGWNLKTIDINRD